MARLLPVLLLLSAATLAAGTCSAAADDNGTPGRMILVLDSSGSMKEPDAAGEPKIAAAKQALRKVVDSLPADQPVGLRVFGATVFSKSDNGACTDSQLKVPVSTGNHARLLTAIGSYKPYGETPIGYALQQAGKDLGSTGKRNIVLVSDGVPTCKPDPCTVAKELSRDGIDLKIDVVGLDVDGAARKALQCIASAGNGTYYDVDNAQDFASSLIKVATRAARPYAAIGRPVTGTTTASVAPTISNGDWLDHTNADGTLYYKITRTSTRSSIAISAAIRTPNVHLPSSAIELSTPDGTRCAISGTVEEWAANTLISTAASTGELDSFGDPDLDSPCLNAKDLIAEVTYEHMTPGVPVELRVLELPRVSSVGSLPKPVDERHWVAPARTTPKAAVGGTSFDNAPQLAPGSYTDTIVPGETQTYQVKVGWGQQLTAAVHIAGLDEAHAVAEKGYPVAKVQIFDPARSPIDGSVDGHLVQEALHNGVPQDLGAVAGPVRYRNESRDGSIAGVYTVTVFLEKNADNRAVPVPYRLDLGVSGTVSGVPRFAEAPTAPGAAGPATHDTASSSGGGFPTGPVLGGVAALVVIAGVGLAWRSRARRTTEDGDAL